MRRRALLLGGDKAFSLAVWNEATIWDKSAAREIGAAAHDVSVALGATYTSVAVYDPLVGTAPISSKNTR